MGLDRFFVVTAGTLRGSGGRGCGGSRSESLSLDFSSFLPIPATCPRLDCLGWEKGSEARTPREGVILGTEGQVLVDGFIQN